MKFALKGFFSIMLLIGATSWVAQSYADCGTGSCGTTNGCGDNSECDCADINVSCCTNLCDGENIYGKTFYAARSQGDNSARKMMGTESMIHRFGSECFYGVGFIAVEYQAAFRNLNEIGKWFGTTGNAHMTYGVVDGTATAQTDFDINALNFGVTGSGTIAFCPKSSDIIADLNMYFGLDELFCGLWARLDIPVANSRRTMNVIEVVSGPSASTYPVDLFGATDAAVFANDTAPMTAALTNGTAVVDLPALKYGKIGGKRTATNVAGLRVDLGYDIFRRERWHLAASLDFVAPLGSSTSAEYLFDAMVGDSKRAQIGGTVNFAYELWNNCDATHNIAFYSDLTVTAMLKKNVNRLIGVNIPVAAGSLALSATETAQASVWSQYLPVKVYNAAGLVTGLDRVANLVGGKCFQVGTVADVDFAFMFEWKCHCWFAGAGYELWLRSAESATQSCITLAADTYVLKGVSTWDGTVNTVAGANEIAQPFSTIAQNGANVAITAANIAANALSDANLDYCRALHPQALSNKLFGYVGYGWTECDWQPFALIGGEVEFGNDNRALSQWGVLGKFGISF